MGKLEMPSNIKNIERKSSKYKSFPDAGIGVWGSEIREKSYDKLHNAVMGRIKHISGRIDSYLPPYDKNYKVDQSLAVNLENSFDELAQLYLELAKEGYGGYFYPIKEDKTYSFEVIKVFDEKFEEIHNLILEAEAPLFEEKHQSDKLSDEEKNVLREKGINMLKEAVEKINKLKQALLSRYPLT
jgi:hypothetical protein